MNRFVEEFGHKYFFCGQLKPMPGLKEFSHKYFSCGQLKPMDGVKEFGHKYFYHGELKPLPGFHHGELVPLIDGDENEEEDEELISVYEFINEQHEIHIDKR